MIEQGKVAAFIPVRGGSKSVPLKNVKIIAGKPLVQWVLEAAVNAACIDAVYVATDSGEIAQVVHSLNLSKVSVIGRSPETATDEASTESALIEFCHQYDFEQIFLIQATSPLLTSSDLQSGWREYQKTSFDSILSVVRQKRFVWRESETGAMPVNYDPLQRPRRQEFDGYLIENGAFYLSSRQSILSSECRISGRVGVSEMCAESYYELDEPADWAIVESFLENRQSSAADMTDIRMLVMDCDGVMTDTGMYYSETGEAFKKFSTRDGMAIELLRNAGLKSAIVTGENTLFAKRRAEKLKIDHVVLGAKDKKAELLSLSKKAGVKLTEIAYIGDDINDLSAMRLCGVTACPADAAKEVRETVDIVLKSRGGAGVVRELVELILSK